MRQACAPRLLMYQQVRSAELGMTLLEVMLAMLMLVAFTGVFVAVTEFTSRFMRESEEVLPGSQGLLVDQHALQMAMDRWADVLAQPGFSMADIQAITQKPCSYNPVVDWDIPGESSFTPPGYRFCLQATSLAESALDDLLAKRQGAKPGIYVIQALPEEVSGAALPARRLFCRPKPFC